MEERVQVDAYWCTPTGTRFEVAEVGYTSDTQKDSVTACRVDCTGARRNL